MAGMTGLPRRNRGRQNGAAIEAYQAELRAFCDRILEIKSRLDFQVGTRGWCYLLEGDHIITKGEFDDAERLITQCRKDGLLPLDICSEDDKRKVDGLEALDDRDIDEEAGSVVDHVRSYADYAHLNYTPFSFWDDLNVYVEIAVEKSDLKSLFARAVGWCPDNLIIDRFGLNKDFIDAHRLTWIDNLITGSGKNLTDKTHPDHFKSYVQDYLKAFGAQKVEANALVARSEAGGQLCEQAILRWVPEDAVGNYRASLAEVREELRRAIVAQLAEGRG